MRTQAFAVILCVQWVLWTLPVHAAVPTAPASPEAPAVASHCAPSPAETPAADPQPRGGEGACMLHCTTLAQAAVGAAPSLSASGLLLLPIPGAASAALLRASATATAPASPPGPPARERLLQNSVLRL